MKAIAERLIKVAIYPTTEEYREEAKAYFREYHADFLKSFNKQTQWVAYYETNIYTPVSLCNLHNIYNIS